MDTVRMEFTGPNAGAITYKGKPGSNRQYRASSLPTGKFHNVHPEDVPFLERVGLFKRVERVDQPVPLQPSIPNTTPVGQVNDPRVEAMFAGLPGTSPVLSPPQTPAAPSTGKVSEPIPVLPPPAEDIPSDLPKVSAMKVEDIQKAAPTAGKGILLAWLQEEQDGKKRAGALEAINKALEGLLA